MKLLIGCPFLSLHLLNNNMNAIQDEFTDLPISRQRKNQLRDIKEGLCSSCRTVPNTHGELCLICYSKKRTGWRKKIRARKIYNSKYQPWVIGPSQKILMALSDGIEKRIKDLIIETGAGCSMGNCLTLLAKSGKIIRRHGWVKIAP